MKKKVALKAFAERTKQYPVPKEPCETWRKGDIKDLIRIMADNDEGFENIIFEVGCNIVAKAFKKQLRGKRTDIETSSTNIEKEECYHN